MVDLLEKKGMGVGWGMLNNGLKVGFRLLVHGRKLEMLDLKQMEISGPLNVQYATKSKKTQPDWMPPKGTEEVKLKLYNSLTRKKIHDSGAIYWTVSILLNQKFLGMVFAILKSEDNTQIAMATI
ncbi:hypothetical protein KUTeg_023034 [Tegillarca granosa]|uniref:Uncharacterized protein n=1 Tax=Tegillarca granosa TaxID=220873 RepID=A0ABQ9E0X0_TEGGR|nr:hypothetical protein KUTeg_023034 [Tegillarca granosa]